MYKIFTIPGRKLHSELSFKVTPYLKNGVWSLIEFSLQSPLLYIEVKNVGFGIRPLWIQVRAQLPNDHDLEQALYHPEPQSLHL